MTDDLKYKIAIEQIPLIGSVNAKRLIAYCGSAEAVFKEKKNALMKVPGIGEVIANEIINQDVLQVAENEIGFIEKYKIQPLFYLDSDYPERLRHCEDGPVMMYVKSTTKVNFNSDKVISIVGTRKATDYGKNLCNTLIADIVAKGYKPIIVSGLAYGIDIAAHRAAVKNGLVTIAVLAHGLNTIYPAVHRNTAKEIIDDGALVSDFLSATTFDRKNFLKRNRIIAGLADATIVVESASEGGALVTADIANSYNREVYAMPGSVNSNYSKGCHWLIKRNKAALLENANDLEEYLNWTKSTKSQPRQTFIQFDSFNNNEQKILTFLKENGETNIDLIAIQTGLPVATTLSMLLNLEFAGAVVSNPGKKFKLH